MVNFVFDPCKVCIIILISECFYNKRAECNGTFYVQRSDFESVQQRKEKPIDNLARSDLKETLSSDVNW